MQVSLVSIVVLAAFLTLAGCSVQPGVGKVSGLIEISNPNGSQLIVSGAWLAQRLQTTEEK